MDVVEEFRQFVLPPAPQEEDIGVGDPRWGPLDAEDILLRRIDFIKIITFHTMETQVKLQKSENVNEKLKETVSVLQGELGETKITCEQKQVKIQELQRKLTMVGRLVSSRPGWRSFSAGEYECPRARGIHSTAFYILVRRISLRQSQNPRRICTMWFIPTLQFPQSP